MTPGRFFHQLLCHMLPVIVFLFGVPALAQNDPPGRVGRLNHTEGPVTFSPTGDNEWIDAELNRPLVRGDRLWTDKGSRAEIQVGSSAVRMGGQTQLEVLTLDDQATQLSVTQGTVYLRVRSLPEGENFEIDTPNLAYRAAYPGDYRVDVDATRGTTRVTIHSGTGAVYGETGQALPLGGGQQITFRARSLAQVDKQESPPQDNFDRWAAERNRREDQSVSARFVPREVVGYQQLDAHGQWTQDGTHGAVWFPQSTAQNWAPYRHGRWEWITPWGWTWIDDAPWGFAPSHYGRWTMIDSRWGWVPGRPGLRPIYAPALVAFIGGGSTSTWSIPIAAGRPGVAWFPLAPGEAWQPGFQASQAYISNVNRSMSPLPSASYAHQSRPEALTAISAEDFHRGRPVRGSWLRVAANALTKAQIVAPPPMPEAHVLASRDRPATARAAPPPQADIRQVAVGTAQQASRPQAAQVPPPRPDQAKQQQVAATEQAKLAEQAQIAEQNKVAEQLKLAREAKLAEQAKTEQAKLAQAKAAEQVKAAEQGRIASAKAKAAEQAKAAEEARIAEQARLAQARAAEQVKLAQQARAAEQARALREAKAIEQAKAAVRQAKAAEQARLAQQARAAEQAKSAVQQARNAEQARLTGQLAKPAEQAKLAQKAKADRIVQQERVAEQARAAQRGKAAERARRIEVAKADEVQKRERQGKSVGSRREQLASRDKREVASRQIEASQREQQARRAASARRDTVVAARPADKGRSAHAERVEQIRLAADREADALRAQRELARRNGMEREQAEREAWERRQQALSEQWRRDQQQQQQQALEQRSRARQRPDLRYERPVQPPEVWQRGIPILNPGRTS